MAPPLFSGYLPHILYSVANVSLALHLVYQRNAFAEEKARINGQESVLESIADELRSNRPLSVDDLQMLKRLARNSGQNTDEVEESISWKNALLGRSKARTSENARRVAAAHDPEQVWASTAMNSVLQTGKNVLRFLRPGGNPHVYSSAYPPLLFRRSPWWAKYTWGLVACDLFMTASAMELTWKHWTEPVETDKKSNSSEATHSHSEFQLRPVWQRLGLCLGFFVGGAGVASMLFIAGFRYIKVLDVFPPLGNAATRKANMPAVAGLEERRVFIQSARHSRSRGISFPLSNCTLHRGRADSEILLTVDNEKGHWHIALDDDSVVSGQKYKGSAAREVLLREWKGGWVSDDFAQPTGSLPAPRPVYVPKKKKQGIQNESGKGKERTLEKRKQSL
ncbi:hypothetical protein D9757_009355 [Collybiopsis confluens]|uniref:Uncharacterized protein n=1 Tax=Collybiopsis confluens TaxID=2823264 RepID=A0A8H5M1D9_9AGAR|nr:hypothetical protein D9757_009355 [Collybiopsis confluens]